MSHFTETETVVCGLTQLLTEAGLDVGSEVRKDQATGVTLSVRFWLDGEELHSPWVNLQPAAGKNHYY